MPWPIFYVEGMNMSVRSDNWKILTLVLLASMALLARPLQGEAGEIKPEIVLGMSTALTGPAKDLGLGMRAGVNLALERVNLEGGVEGRQLRLVALDDGYEPSRTGPSMRRLIYEDKVAAVVGNVGTPTAIVAAPIAREAGVLFYGAFTGAKVLRKVPPDHFVINFRASYEQEVEAMVKALMEYGELDLGEIAFFTQRDSFGDAGYAAGVKAFKKYGLDNFMEHLHTRYERNTLAVENAVADVLFSDSEIRAIIMVGAYGPCAKFIRLCRENGVNPLFLTVSFVGSEALAKSLGPGGDGVVVTQVVPNPEGPTPLARQFRQDSKRFAQGEVHGFVAFEGYIAARIFTDAMAYTAGEDPRKELVEALESLGDFDPGLGIALSLGPDDHQASDAIWPTLLENGKYVPFEWGRVREMTKSQWDRQ